MRAWIDSFDALTSVIKVAEAKRPAVTSRGSLDPIALAQNPNAPARKQNWSMP